MTVRRGDRPWPAATQALLVGVGVVLGVVTFLGVLTMPDLPFHPARDLELEATYDTYRETGCCSSRTPAPAPGTAPWRAPV